MDFETEFAMAAGEEGSVWTVMALVFFMGVFGYAYCASKPSEEEEVTADPEIDTAIDMSKKEQKSLKKFAEEIQKEKDKIAKMEERMLRFQKTLEKKPTAVKFQDATPATNVQDQSSAAKMTGKSQDKSSTAKVQDKTSYADASKSGSKTANASPSKEDMKRPSESETRKNPKATL